jgi:hypothetical protein
MNLRAVCIMIKRTEAMMMMEGEAAGKREIA